MKEPGSTGEPGWRGEPASTGERASTGEQGSPGELGPAVEPELVKAGPLSRPGQAGLLSGPHLSRGRVWYGLLHQAEHSATHRAEYILPAWRRPARRETRS